MWCNGLLQYSWTSEFIENAGKLYLISTIVISHELNYELLHYYLF